MAGRHKKNNADYFIHDKDMRHDRRIQALCKRFGQFKGYCIFNWLLEVLTDSSNFCVKWDSEEIEKRFQFIAERFKKIWKFPDIDIEEGYQYDEVNIFEAEDPTHKKLSYAIFFDQKLPFKRVSELYVHVIKTLFELQPNTFFTTDLAERIALSHEQDKLRQPVQINETYYIEAKLDNTGKFERIKHALSIFDIADDLFIKRDVDDEYAKND